MNKHDFDSFRIEGSMIYCSTSEPKQKLIEQEIYERDNRLGNEWGRVRRLRLKKPRVLPKHFHREAKAPRLSSNMLHDSQMFL